MWDWARARARARAKARARARTGARLVGTTYYSLTTGHLLTTYYLVVRHVLMP